MLKSGLYEQVINKEIDAKLSALEDKLSQTVSIDKAEGSKILTKYIAEIIEKGLDNVLDNGGDIDAQVELVNKIVTTIINETKEADFDMLKISERAEQLFAILDKNKRTFALNEK